MTLAVLELARTLAAKSPLDSRGFKEVMNFSRDHSIADGLNEGISARREQASRVFGD